MENSETQVWLDFALKCDYLQAETHKLFTDRCEEVGRLLNHMMSHPQTYGSKWMECCQLYNADLPIESVMLPTAYRLLPTSKSYLVINLFY